MKIFHAAETIRGGLATVLQYNIDAQTKMYGADHVLVLIPRSHAEDLGDAEPCSVFLFERDGRNVRSFYSFLKKFVRIVRQEKPEIVHLHSSFAGLMGRLALIPLRFLGCRPKVIYCPHGFGFLMDGVAWKKKLYALIEKFFLFFTDAVICVSRYERDTAKKYGLSTKKLTVIYNGVPVSAGSDAVPEQRQERMDRTVRLLYLGRLDYAKGFDLLARAMKELEKEPFHLTVVGSILQSKEAPPTLPNITYVGWMPLSRIGFYIRACDVLVMPSRWESFGLSAAEAATFGRPALVSNCCSLPEIVIDGKTGLLFPVGNVQEMVRLLRETSLDRWDEMGEVARVHVSSTFSVDEMTCNTVALYRTVMKNRNPDSGQA